MRNLKERPDPIEADMAWASTARPGAMDFTCPVKKDICDAIARPLSGALPGVKTGGSIVLRSLKPCVDPAGHYKLENSGRSYFIRVTRRVRKDTIIEDIAAFHLSNAGLKTNIPIVSDLRISWRGREYLMYAYPFIKGRHYNGSPDDLAAAGRVVAQAHQILKSFKYAHRIRDNAFKIARRLSGVKASMARALDNRRYSVFREHAGWAGKNHDWLKNMTVGFEPFLCRMPGAQCVHGELHLGNIIYPECGGGPILTDLEEVSDSWFPVTFDIAYLVHRFCFDGHPEPSLLSRRLDILRKSYGRVSPGLKDMMRQVAWYNMALIMDRSFRTESVVSDEECDKFVRLESLAGMMPA